MEQHEARWSKRPVHAGRWTVLEFEVRCSCGRYRKDWTESVVRAEQGIRDHILASARKRKRRR